MDRTDAHPEDVIGARLAALVANVEQATTCVVAGDPEGIHDLRVAIRRARSCLRTFRPLFAREQVEEVRRELEWMATLLGAARDPQVLATRVERRLDGLDVEERMGPVRRELVGACRATTGRGRAEVIETFETERYRRLLARLDDLALQPPYRSGPSTSGLPALLRCVRKEDRRAQRLANRAERVATGPERDRAFHEARKCAKRVRYAAECLVPIAPRAARRLAKRYESVQDLLGERHDAVVARQFLVSEGRRVGAQPAHNGFAYGALAEQEREAIRVAEQRWPGVWHKASRDKLRRFLAA